MTPGSRFSVRRCERTTYAQAVLRPVPLHRYDNMGEEILHPDRQPAGAAQQGERGERNARGLFSPCLLFFVGEMGRPFLHLLLFVVAHEVSDERERRELTYSACRNSSSTHSRNLAGPDAGCMEEVTANCVRPPLLAGVLCPAFNSATPSFCIIAAFNGK